MTGCKDVYIIDGITVEVTQEELKLITECYDKIVIQNNGQLIVNYSNGVVRYGGK